MVQRRLRHRRDVVVPVSTKKLWFKHHWIFKLLCAFALYNVFVQTLSKFIRCLGHYIVFYKKKIVSFSLSLMCNHQDEYPGFNLVI